MLSEHIRNKYKIVWEIPMKHVIDMAADRGAYIDQSQSFNVHMSYPNFGKLTSLHFHAWKKGLKTGMYYLRTRAAADAIKFTVDQQALQKKKSDREILRSSSTASQAKENKGLVKPKKTAAELDSEAERERQLAAMVCSIENKDACIMCSG